MAVTRVGSSGDDRKRRGDDASLAGQRHRDRQGSSPRRPDADSALTGAHGHRGGSRNDPVGPETSGDAGAGIDVSPAQSAARHEDVVSLLGPALPVVESFAGMLAVDGVLRGLIGPRELPRLWDRHLLNSAAVAAFLPREGTVIDVGSGAGFPGVVLAAMRPDLSVVLVESMQRRTDWLDHVKERLELGNLDVVRSRAEDLHGSMSAEIVTARAVAPMDRLASWCLPLVRPGGQLIAMKGSRAHEELEAAQKTLRKLGGDAGEVREAPVVPGVDPTFVVCITRVR